MFCTDNTDDIHILSTSLMNIASIFHMLPKRLYIFHIINIFTHNVNKNNLQSKCIQINV